MKIREISYRVILACEMRDAGIEEMAFVHSPSKPLGNPWTRNSINGILGAHFGWEPLDFGTPGYCPTCPPACYASAFVLDRLGNRNETSVKNDTIYILK